jgi:Tol biopolymer transport system component
LPEAQSTQDGAFLVFCSYGQLLPEDTDSAKDVYRYDAQTGTLQRISVGVNDYHANGNSDAFDANIALSLSFSGSVDAVNLQHELTTRAVSENGSVIVFDTSEPLSPAATNGKVDIYEWDEGNVSLISSGTAEEDDGEATITPSGRDIMFLTAQGLVRADTDGLPDIYDARVDGGFLESPAQPQPCSGDACQGPLTNPAPLLIPGSVSQAPGGNFTAPAAKAVVKTKKVKSKKAKAKKKKKKGRASRKTHIDSGTTAGSGR